MSKILTMARRELSGYFLSPIAYVVAALFLVAAGLIFFYGSGLGGIEAIFVPGREASLRPLFEWIAYLMVAVVPLLTMRLISDEYASGTIETLMTAPVTETQVVLGKFLGVLCFYAVLIASTAIFLVPLALYGEPDAGVAISGYAGLVLIGCAFLAVGVFASTLTRHQILSAIVAIGILSVFSVMMQALTIYGPTPWNAIADRLSVMAYFKGFARGVLDTRGIAFFLTTAAMFLFLSVKTLESRRWR